jgi:hypothetical protein
MYFLEGLGSGSAILSAAVNAAAGSKFPLRTSMHPSGRQARIPGNATRYGRQHRRREGV